MILAPIEIFGNGSLMWVTGGRGMPAGIQGLRAQSPRSPSVLGAAPHPPPSQIGQLFQLTDEELEITEAKGFGARSFHK